jgi:GT2 family glycosyltransferase
MTNMWIADGGPASTATVSVLIVNYRTPDLTVAAVESALAEPETLEVILVDNDSQDSSMEMFSRYFSGVQRVQVIGASENKGFGAGNNLAAENASGDLLFLLNSDATFVAGSLATLVKFRSNHGQRCVVAPAVYAGSTDALQVDAIGPFPTAVRILTQRSNGLAGAHS